MIAGKHITVGITGGIAAYKAADIVSWLNQQGARVQVVMTEGACRIITPLTMKTLSGRPVARDIFSEDGDFQVPHIDVAACDAFIIVPATANIIAKAAHGLADDLLSAALLATAAPLIFAPAMNINMYAHAATQANLRILRERGCHIIEPAEGRLACGTIGKGRLPDTQTLKREITRLLTPPARLLDGRKVLVTAGPTYEYIDPARFLGNRSSGKMGYALAEAAAAAGAEVTLISGPTALSAPPGLRRICVTGADEMYDAVWSAYPACDTVIMAAAVADYKAAAPAAHKIKKGREMSLALTANRDILASLGREKGEKTLIGFAAETENLLAYATEKLRQKNLDMIVANHVLTEGAGFDGDTNIVSVIRPFENTVRVDEWPLLEKKELARRLIAEIAALAPLTCNP
ncbi:MAG: bifunctional phosphopantothenoylcysteine decarboxylase/phosphopantothenate--cysteine ligase CoaBC [Clostridiales bacterium]|nr:bifunctional phosphopantothenoylcysteine decarboxylase/phosphopantothenate--cysteine ligase CoaBC [Clostridiales bacterium]